MSYETNKRALKQISLRDWVGWWQIRWPFILIIFTSLIAVIGVVNLTRDVINGTPFGGVLTNPDPKSSKIAINTPIWWPGLVEGRLKHGDTLLSIEGLPYTNPQDKEIFRQAAAQNKKSVSVALLRNGEELAVLLPVERFSTIYWLDIQMPGLLLGLSFALLAIIIYQAGPKKPLNQVAVVFSSIFILFAIDHSSVFMYDTQLSVILRYIISIRGALIGVLFIHFALLFPFPHPRLNKRIVVGLYTIALFVAASRVIYRFMLLHFGTLDPIAWIGLVRQLWWVLLLIGIFTVFLRSVSILWRKELSRRQQEETRLFLVGLAIPTPFVVWQAANGILNREQALFWYFADLRYLYLLPPIALSIIILRYKATQGAPLLFLLVPCLAVSGFMASLGNAILLSTQSLNGNTYSIHPFIIFFTLFFLICLGWAYQSTLKGWFGRLSQRDSYSATKQFRQILLRQQGTDELKTHLAQTLCDELSLTCTAIWLREAKTNSLKQMGQAGIWLKAPPETLVLPTSKAIQPSVPIQINPPLQDIPDWIAPLSENRSALVAVPLVGHKRLIGLLVLGRRRNRYLFNFDKSDLDIIELIGQQLTLSLLAAQQLDVLRQIPQQLIQAQESERTRIARELHDSTQQVLLQTTFDLDTARVYMATNHQAADDLLEKCIDMIEKEGQALIRLRTGLDPSQLKFGLRQPLSDFIAQVQHRSVLSITFAASDWLDSLIPTTFRLAIFRVIQQALDNIVQHAQAHQVSIIFKQDTDNIFFHITDDGVGSSKEYRDERQRQGHYGLRSMANRIEIIGGTFSFVSAPNQGTQIDVAIPRISLKANEPQSNFYDVSWIG